jgi:hypothetical protein
LSASYIAFELLPIEIKASQTPMLDFCKSLRLIRKLFPDEVQGGVVIYNGEAEMEMEGVRFVNWKGAGGAAGSGNGQPKPE